MQKQWHRVTLVILICALGTGAFLANVGSTADNAKSPTPTLTAPEIKDYKKWKAVNPYGFALSPEMQVLCRAVSPNELDKSSHPDTKGKYIHVLVNEKGQTAMFQAKNPHFPEGSVIVKEKWSPKNQKQPELLTIMIKQRAGYDPKNGDWEYLVTDGDSKKVQARGKLENCQSCHVKQSKNDYVFRTYLKTK